MEAASRHISGIFLAGSGPCTEDFLIFLSSVLVYYRSYQGERLD